MEKGRDLVSASGARDCARPAPGRGRAGGALPPYGVESGLRAPPGISRARKKRGGRGAGGGVGVCAGGSQARDRIPGREAGQEKPGAVPWRAWCWGDGIGARPGRRAFERADQHAVHRGGGELGLCRRSPLELLEEGPCGTDRRGRRIPANPSVRNCFHRVLAHLRGDGPARFRMTWIPVPDILLPEHFG